MSEWTPRAVKVYHPGIGRVAHPIRYHSSQALAWVSGGLKLATGGTYPTLPTIRSARVRELFGVNAHLAWQWSPYVSNLNTEDATFQAISDLGVGYFRDVYIGGGDTQQNRMIPRLVAAGVKYYAGMFGFSMTETDMAALVEDCLARYPDPAMFEAITGLNEPDDPGVDWQQHSIDLQRALWTTLRSHADFGNVPIMAPAMKLVALTDIPGVAPYFDLAPIHHYPVAGKAFINTAAQGQSLDYKIDAYAATFPGKGISVDEYGTVTSNSVFPSASSSSVPEEVTVVYHPRAVCEAVRRDIRVCMYELLDQADKSAEFGAHFGLVDTTNGVTDPSSWRRKQSFYSLARLIALTRDDGPAAAAVPLQAAMDGGASDSKTLVLSKRTGEHGILHWRDSLIYDGGTKTMISVAPVAQTVTLPVPRAVTLTDVVTGQVTSLGPVRTYTAQVAGNVIHARIAPA